jgi:hypothetical protein
VPEVAVRGALHQARHVALLTLTDIAAVSPEVVQGTRNPFGGVWRITMERK